MIAMFRTRFILTLCLLPPLHAHYSKSLTGFLENDLFTRPTATCPSRGDEDLSQSAPGPWTHNPVCYYAKRIAEQNSASPFCVYTYIDSGTRQAISTLTTPQVAEHIARQSIINEQVKQQVIPQDVSESRREKIYERKKLPNRGIGLFAQIPIQPGQVILVDTPRIILVQEALGSLAEKHRQEAQWTALLQLHDEVQREVRSLARGNRVTEDELDGIIRTNAVGQFYGNGIRHVSVLPEFSVSQVEKIVLNK
jgi:hypothetical protein